MSEADARRAWVQRVLGITLSDDANPAELRTRVARMAATVKQLAAGGAPEGPTLSALLRDAIGALKAAEVDPEALAAAATAVDAADAAVARAQSAARGREAASANSRTIDGTKLLLRWRGAQSQVAQNLAGLGRALLATDEVRADPRIAAVERAVAALPNLVPEFGGRLEDLLDQAITAGSSAAIAKDALDAIAAYRQRLAGAVALIQLEAFAKQRIGQDFALFRELDGALGEIAASFAKAA